MHPEEEILHCEVQHVDGKQNVMVRNQKLDWLKADTTNQGNLYRILSNARCLSEGVDVPALDAVIFLSPRNCTYSRSVYGDRDFYGAVVAEWFDCTAGFGTEVSAGASRE